MDHNFLTGHQIAAARTLANMTQKDLADRANISVPTLKRMEGTKGEIVAMSNNARAVRGALENAGVVFLSDGETTSGGPGVRLRDRQS
ncbi:helix-turn-helix domain-containing protein [Sinorhizobium medicae]|uniref:helix-turn-helix domain-containing protein n=1 Tax=Sinorhizobium medicae TaxID=110321 RepID=UPI003B51E5F5